LLVYFINRYKRTIVIRSPKNSDVPGGMAGDRQALKTFLNNKLRVKLTSNRPPDIEKP